jgi:hypothetical protein
MAWGQQCGGWTTAGTEVVLGLGAWAASRQLTQRRCGDWAAIGVEATHQLGHVSQQHDAEPTRGLVVWDGKGGLNQQ